MMGDWAQTNLDCPCGDHRGCYGIHEDGHGFCFSCKKAFRGKESMDEEVTYEYIERRGIEKATHQFFDVKAAINANGRPVSVDYIFPNGAVQTRRLDHKAFYS